MAIVTTAAGCVGLAGWSVDSDVLKRGFIAAPVMKPNTALCLITIGVSLWLASRVTLSRAARLIAFVSAGATLALTLATLFEYVAGINLGIDGPFFSIPPGSGSSLPPGRMSPYSAFCFAAVAGALILKCLPRKPRFFAPAAGAIGTVVIAVSLLSLGAHYTNTFLGIRWWGPATMGIQSSIAFAAIGAVLIGFAVSEYQLRWFLGRWTTALLFVSVLLLLALNAFVHYASGQMLNSGVWAAHAQEVRFRNSQVLVGLESIQLGQRGFILTGRPSFLKESEDGQVQTGQAIAALRHLTADNPSQQPRIDRLQALFDGNVRFAHQVEDKFQRNGQAAAAAMMSPGDALFLAGQMREVAAAIDAEEARLADERAAEAERIFDRHFMLLPIGTFVSLLLLSFVLFVLNRHAAERKLADKSLRESEERFRTTFESLLEGCQIIGFDWRYISVNRVAAAHGGKPASELIGRRMMEAYPGIDDTEMFAVLRRCMHERQPAQIENRFRHESGEFTWFELVIQPVPEGLFVLSLDITARKQAADDIRALNEDLEKRVLSRTAELDNANRELEAFSYSVSHDLRAPLRGIDGFARVLREDYAGLLGDEGRRVLDVIGGETRRMGTLIDDLLRFSRISRLALQQAEVDMAYLAQDVVDELLRQYTTPAASIRLQKLPEVVGDRAMLRQVWFNLIGNALKFSSRQPHPMVDISCREDGNFHVFQIRDNGVGFDDRYAAKLFNVFQRLHSETEFEGTGVGLALVSRIISRHGGRIWADGKPNLGATFTFTLPNPTPA